MEQDEQWLTRYNEVKTIVETNKCNLSKHNPEERYKYCNWLKHKKNSSMQEK